MKYIRYSHEDLKKAVAGAINPAALDLTKLMKQPLSSDDGEPPPAPYPSARIALVAALGMAVRCGGIFSADEVKALQRSAAAGNKESLKALYAMQQTRRIDKTKALGVLLWKIKFGGERGVDVFLTAAHLLAEELGRKQKRGLGPTYVAVVQCALTEYLHDRCTPCHGTGQTGRSRKDAGRNHPALYTCADCGGTGAYSPGNSQRALALRMDVESFVAKWAKRYDAVLATLDRIDRAAGKAVDTQVRRDYAATTDRRPEQ